MRWPWQRDRNNGAAAQTAKDDASQQLADAHEGRRRTDKTIRAADEAVRRADRFVRDTERSLHLKRGPA